MFLNETSLQLQIEEKVSKLRMSYIEAMISFCDENDLDYKDITKLLSPNLKDKIKLCAQEEGFMRVESRLPV